MRSPSFGRWIVICGGALFLAGIVAALAGSGGTGLVIPDQARNRPNPVAATPESIDQGKQLYSTQCVMCHGARGDGTGDLVERLKLSMPDFTDRAAMARRTDGELFYVMEVGHERMPSQGERFKDESRWNLVNYIRTLSRARPDSTD